MSLYGWVVYAHVAGVLLFVLAHGVSAFVLLRLRAEREPARIGALLDLSRWTLNVAFVGFLVLVIAGVAAGIMGGHFAGRLWLWVSILIFVAVMLSMTPLGRGYLDEVRQAVGAPTGNKKKDATPPPPATAEQLAVVLQDRRPLITATIGFLGLFVVLWLMMSKPF